eukprot:m.170615 g.170615  ORF g.170615 m.170615 type:complete len:115 (-) comp31616_c0_seq1:2743-3087(-)
MLLSLASSISFLPLSSIFLPILLSLPLPLLRLFAPLHISLKYFNNNASTSTDDFEFAVPMDQPVEVQRLKPHVKGVLSFSMWYKFQFSCDEAVRVDGPYFNRADAIDDVSVNLK